jgi:hypothetical protein
VAATEFERDALRWGAIAWYLIAAAGLSWTLGTQLYVWAGWALFLIASVAPAVWAVGQIKADLLAAEDERENAPGAWAGPSAQPSGMSVVPRSGPPSPPPQRPRPNFSNSGDDIIGAP